MSAFLFLHIHNFIENKKDLLKNKITNRDNPEKDVTQFQKVLETWKQLLNSRMEENVLLKIKISEIVKNNYDRNFLEEIEEFQTQFITEDELIHSLRSEVHELNNFLYDKMFEDEKKKKMFDPKMESLRRDMVNSVSRFGNLQTAFDEFQRKISGSLKNEKL